METALAVVGVIAGIVSLLLGGLAIWLSLYFYTQAKAVETNVQIALAAIQAQTDTLQSLNAKTLDRLTKYVTTPREDASQTTELLFSTLRELPSLVLSLRLPSDTSGEAALRAELVDNYIVLWHYAGTANVWIAGYLPTPENFIETDPNHARIKHLVDRSAGDFRYLETLVNQMHPSEIRAANYQNHYNEILTRLMPFVGDTAEHWARRSQQG